MTNAWEITGVTLKNNVKIEDFFAIKFLFVSVLVIFLFKNGTYFPNVPRIFI